jgi:hypothetical protein
MEQQYPGPPMMLPPPPPPKKSNMGMYIGIGFVIVVICCIMSFFAMKKKKEEAEVKVPVTPLCGSGTSLNKRTNTCVTTPASGTLAIGDYCFETNSMCSSGNCYSVTGNCGVGVTTSSSSVSVAASSSVVNSIGSATSGAAAPSTNELLSTFTGKLTGSTPDTPCALSLALWGLKSGYLPADVDTDATLRTNIKNFFTTANAPLLSKSTTINPSYATTVQMACAPVISCTSNIIPWMKSIGYTTEVDTIMNYTGTQAAFTSPFTAAQKAAFNAALSSHALETVNQKDGTPQTTAQKAIATALNTTCKDIITAIP